MKESSESQKWKSEELREQRKARLAEMKIERWRQKTSRPETA
jgi:hypothetical protein